MSSSSNNTFILSDNNFVRAKKFADFYYKILKDYFLFDEKNALRVKEILKSVEKLVADDFKKDFEVFQFAYLFLNGVHDTCMSLEMFYQSTVKYTKILQRLSCKTRIKLCCMDSSSLLAALGICYVINETLLKFGFLSTSPTEIQIFFIDKNHRWKHLSRHIVNCANSEYTQVELNLVYLKGYGLKTFTDAVQLSIQKSHIVIMSKFLSQFPACKTITRILKKTLVEMKKNAILFYLDDNHSRHLDTIKHLISTNEDFSEIQSTEKRFVPCEATKSYQYELYKSVFPFKSHSKFSPVLSLVCIKSPNIILKTNVENALPVRTGESAEGFRAKVSSNQLRNSKVRYILHGRLSHVDMEKRNKDDSNRKTAKEVSVSRYANFEEDY